MILKETGMSNQQSLPEPDRPPTLNADTEVRNRSVAQALTMLARSLANRVLWAWRTIPKAWRNLRYITPLKLMNMALVNVQCVLKTETVFGRPYHVAIEPTNICTATCQLCPLREGDAGRQKGEMDWVRYKGLVDEWSRWVYELHLYLWGDPLIAKDIYAMIQYAHRTGMRTLLATNMHAFNPHNGDDIALVKSGLDDLTCSLHAASQRTFEIYQPGRNFDDVTNKVRCLIATRNRLKSKTPSIHLNFVVTKFNEHEISAFEELARDLGCEPFFIEPSLNLRFLGRDRSPEERNRLIEERVKTWLPENPKYIIEPYRRMRDEHMALGQLDDGRKPACKMPWTAAVFNWDGTVAPCFGSRDKAEDFGDLSIAPFKDIWNGPKYRAARQRFNRQVDTDVLCARCSGVML